MQYGVPWEPISESQARELIQDKYPDVEDKDIRISEQPNCEVCDALGCRIIDSCWVANFTTPGGVSHGVVIPGSAPGGNGGIIQDEGNPCTEWWCNAPACTYHYNETTPNVTIDYFNTGCSSPTLACDSEYDKCRECQAHEECVRITETDTGNKSYYFDIIEYNAWGKINDTGLVCELYLFDELVFSNVTTVEDCRERVIRWTTCYVDRCEFEPVYGMIPK